MKNQYDPKKHHRRSIRLKDYDYSQEGLYFVTICVQNKVRLFGHISNGKMILNDAGKMVEQEWLKITKRFSNTELHEYVIMPNHFHAIIEIINPVGATNVPMVKINPKRLGDIIGAFKSIVTDEYIHGVKKLGWERFNGKLFQRNYYEHIIRNLNSFFNISNYINKNPEKWEKDKFYIP